MAFSAEISRHQPGCLFFLVDQSTSMNLPFGNNGTSRAQRLTQAINRLLQELVVRCTKSQDEGVRPYFDIGVFGYGSEAFGPLLGGTLAGRPLVSVSEVAEHPLRLESAKQEIADGNGGTLTTEVRFPIWFELDALGKTPMCAAMQETHAILEPWVAAHPTSLPPLIFNITDGEATDGDPHVAAKRLRTLATEDGSVLLFNVHITSSAEPAVHYPDRPDGLPDAFARQLFQMSSILPTSFQERFDEAGYAISPASRAFVFNAHPSDVIQCIDIGTRLKIQR